MADPRAKETCPYCSGEYSANGILSHVRHKHPSEYVEFKEKRAAGVQSTPKRVTPKPDSTTLETPTQDPQTPKLEPPEVPDNDTTPQTTPKTSDPEPDTPAPTEQKNASFLGEVGKALRDW